MTQKEFLLGFVKHLQSLDDFSNLLSISQAKVPIVKVDCGQIQFDLLFTCIDEPKSVLKLVKQANVMN